jgi:hypothetical protein
LKRSQPSTFLKQLEDILQEEWYKIPSEIVQNLYMSISRNTAGVLLCANILLLLQVTKLFGVNYATPSSTVVQMSTGSTMDSSEWSQALVPSYSEAVLMDAVPDNNNTVVANASQLLFYPGLLADHMPADPFPPPEYEEALRLPVLTRLRRSLTDRGDDMFRCNRERRRSSGVVVRVNMETSL